MKKLLKRFRLKKEYFTSVPDNKHMELYDLIGKIIVEGKSYGTKDHPKFTELRNKLCKLGYIQIELSYWNGDIVLKPFKLNELTFEKDESFLCACALGIKLDLLKLKKTV